VQLNEEPVGSIVRCGDFLIERIRQREAAFLHARLEAARTVQVVEQRFVNDGGLGRPEIHCRHCLATAIIGKASIRDGRVSRNPHFGSDARQNSMCRLLGN